MNRDLIESYGGIDGGFNDLASFRAELGDDVAHISDADARNIIDENLREKSKLTKDQRAQLDEVKHIDTYEDTVYKDMATNMREKANREENERKRLAAELAKEKSKQLERHNDLNSIISSQSRLRDELELEKLKRLHGDRLAWKSPSSLDDYLIKEKLKREVKEELLDEKRRAKQQHDLNKLWSFKSPAKKSPKNSKHPSHKNAKAKSPKAKFPKAKSPKAKLKSPRKTKK